MGRLKLRKSKAFLLGSIIVSLLVLSAALYFRSRQNAARLRETVETNNLQVGAESLDGISQIYYRIGEKKTFITHDDKNHINPRASGRYVTWTVENNGSFQVMRYDVLAKTTLQLTAFSSNTTPSLDGGRVAWQGTYMKQPAIFLFDGDRVTKISGDHPAIRPFVGSDSVLYAQQVSSSDDTWQTIEFDLDTKRSRVVIEGPGGTASWPRYENGTIRTTLEGSGPYYSF